MKLIVHSYSPPSLSVLFLPNHLPPLAADPAGPGGIIAEVIGGVILVAAVTVDITITIVAVV